MLLRIDFNQLCLHYKYTQQINRLDKSLSCYFIPEGNNKRSGPVFVLRSICTVMLFSYQKF